MTVRKLLNALRHIAKNVSVSFLRRYESRPDGPSTGIMRIILPQTKFKMERMLKLEFDTLGVYKTIVFLQ